MNIQEIFYKTQGVTYYELFTHILKSEKNKNIYIVYQVEWHTISNTIKNEITKEEYEILLEGLKNGNKIN